MTPDPSHLSRFYKGWDNYQDLLVDAVGALSPEQLELRASPSLRPAWGLAAHIIGARVGWFHAIMGEAQNRPDLDDMDAWDQDGAPQRSAAELTEGLRRSWEMVSECLQRWTPDDLDQEFTTHRGVTRSRQWIIWHVLEHDLHHGGEFFLTLGMHGIPGPDM